MTENPTVITRAKKTATDTIGWLLDVCAPALAREIFMATDVDVAEQFRERLEQEIDRLTENLEKQQKERLKNV